MIGRILLNGTALEVGSYNESDIINKNTGKNLKRVEIKLTTNSKSQRETMVNFLKELQKEKEITLEVPEKQSTLKVYVASSAYRYTEGETETFFDIVLEEVDPDDKFPKTIEEFFGKLSFQTIHFIADNWKRIRALVYLLEEKGYIEKGEYEEKLKLVWKRDHKEIYDILLGELNETLGLKKIIEESE